MGLLTPQARLYGFMHAETQARGKEDITECLSQAVNCQSQQCLSASGPPSARTTCLRRRFRRLIHVTSLAPPAAILLPSRSGDPGNVLAAKVSNRPQPRSVLVCLERA